MQSQEQVKSFQVNHALVRVFSSSAGLGRAAAAEASRILAEAIAKRGKARVIVATGNSQIPLADALAEQQIDWPHVEAFHMDEYVGLPADHPASFRRWIRARIEDKLHPGAMFYLNGDAGDLPAEIERYSALLRAEPVDLAFVGFGENGHIAFNDPPVADFRDPATVKIVTLDEACRRQQVGEGHFPALSAVPAQALTVTCPGLFAAVHWISCVPDERKARAVQCALEGPVSETCPASLARTHPNTSIYLDLPSASLLSNQ